MTTTLTVPKTNARPSSAQQHLQTPLRQRPLPRRLPMGCPSTVSERFFLISLRSRKIGSKTKLVVCPSPGSLAPQPCSTKLSNCLGSIPVRCKQYRYGRSQTILMLPTLTLVLLWKFGLASSRSAVEGRCNVGDVATNHGHLHFGLCDALGGDFQNVLLEDGEIGGRSHDERARSVFNDGVFDALELPCDRGPPKGSTGHGLVDCDECIVFEPRNKEPAVEIDDLGGLTDKHLDVGAGSHRDDGLPSNR